MRELVPSPTEVAGLLVAMTQLEWPTDEADRCRYFDLLGLHDLVVLPQRDDEPDSIHVRFDTSLPGVTGICTMFGDQFLGLCLFCYDEPLDDGLQARVGYAALRDLLSRHLGSPIEEWGPPTEPACLWNSGPLHLEMYCFQRLHSGVMVGPSHAGRSAANDAAHDARHAMTADGEEDR